MVTVKLGHLNLHLGCFLQRCAKAYWMVVLGGMKVRVSVVVV